MIDGLSSDRTVLTELGARIARTRLERNMSQQQLAVEAGLSKRTIERMEAGEESKLSNLVRVLRALDLLERIDLLVPEPLPSPIEQLKLHGRRRRRAGRTAAVRRSEPAAPWTWGDERVTPGDGPAERRRGDGPFTPGDDPAERRRRGDEPFTSADDPAERRRRGDEPPGRHAA